MPGGGKELVGDPPGLIGPFIQTIPVHELNEFFARCNMAPKYEVVSRPTEQEPDFMLKMTVGKMNSMGIGRTKAGAKQSAISQLLRTVIPCPNINDTDVRRMRYCAETLVMFTDESLPNMVMESLQRLCESRQKPPPYYRVMCEGLAQSFVTVVTCCVGSTMVVGMGKTKKRAKRHAAFKLLFYFRFGPGKYDDEEGGHAAKECLRDEDCSNATECDGSHEETVMLIKSALAELTNPSDSISVNGTDDISQNDVSPSYVVADDTFHSCMAETTMTDGLYESMENIPAIPYENADVNEVEGGSGLAEGDVRLNRKARSDETLAISRALAASKMEECVTEYQTPASNFTENDGRIIPVGLKQASLELREAVVGSEDRFYPQELVGDNLPVASSLNNKTIKEVYGAEGGRVPSPGRDGSQQQLLEVNMFNDINVDRFADVTGDAETMRSIVTEFETSYHKSREKKRRQCTTQANYNNLENVGCVAAEHYSFTPEKQKCRTIRGAPYIIPQYRTDGANKLPNLRPRLTTEHPEKEQDSLVLKSMKEILQEFPELIQIQVPPSSDEDVCTDSDESRLKLHPPVRLSESREFVTNNRIQGTEQERLALTCQRFNEEHSRNAVGLEPGEILVHHQSEASPKRFKREEICEQGTVYEDNMDDEEKLSQPIHGTDMSFAFPKAKRSNVSVQASMDQISPDPPESNIEDEANSDGQTVSDHLAELNSVAGQLSGKSAVRKPSRKRTVQMVRAGKDKALLFENPNDDLSKAKVFPSLLGKSPNLVEGCSEETLVPKCQTCGSNNAKPLIVGWETADFEERWVDPYAWEPLIYIFLQFAMAFVIIIQIVIGILFIFTDLVSVKQMLFSMLQAGLVVVLVHFS